jgi:AraC-like DNA-binding protein
MRERSPASDTVVVQRAVDLLEAHYADPLTIKTVSLAVHTPPGRLTRVFQRETGVTLHQYLTRLRLERATHLLRSNLKVESVAHSVGYRSKKNFYRQFQNHFGSTPETFRRTPERVSPPSSGLAVYAAQFNGTSCRISVESRKSVKGRPTYVAVPYVVVDHGLQPFAVPSEHVEIAGETAAQAIERAAVFLEHRFGARVVPPTRVSNGRDRLRILAPRP